MSKRQTCEVGDAGDLHLAVFVLDSFGCKELSQAFVATGEVRPGIRAASERTRQPSSPAVFTIGLDVAILCFQPSRGNLE